MSKQNFQFHYWDSNLDPKNLSGNFDSSSFNYELEREFYMTPEQVYAYKIMGDLKGKKVLEIGCGLGVNAMIMRELGAEVYVTDISSSRLKEFKNISFNSGGGDAKGEIKIFQASAEEMPFMDSSFDIIYTKSVLIHTDLKRAASEIRRVLKSGGIAVFVEPMDLNPFVNLYRMFLAPKEWKTITKYFTPMRFFKLGQFFDKYGGKDFFILSFFAFYWQFKTRNLGLFKKSLRLLYWFDESLTRIFPSIKRLSWFRVFYGRKS